MNQNKGSSPFGNMALAGDEKKIDSLVNNLKSSVDSRAILPKSTGTKPRQKARQIYFSGEVENKLAELKKERINISALVDSAVRQHLGL